MLTKDFILHKASLIWQKQPIIIEAFAGTLADLFIKYPGFSLDVNQLPNFLFSGNVAGISSTAVLSVRHNANKRSKALNHEHCCNGVTFTQCDKSSLDLSLNGYIAYPGKRGLVSPVELIKKAVAHVETVTVLPKTHVEPYILPGDKLSLKGNYLGNLTAVRVDSTPAAYTIPSEEIIEVTIPELPGTEDRNSTIVMDFDTGARVEQIIDYVEPPQVEIAPVEPVKKGNTVTLTGSNLNKVDSALLNFNSIDYPLTLTHPDNNTLSFPLPDLGSQDGLFDVKMYTMAGSEYRVTDLQYQAPVVEIMNMTSNVTRADNAFVGGDIITITGTRLNEAYKIILGPYTEALLDTKSYDKATFTMKANNQLTPTPGTQQAYLADPYNTQLSPAFNYYYGGSPTLSIVSQDLNAIYTKSGSTGRLEVTFHNQVDGISMFYNGIWNYIPGPFGTSYQYIQFTIPAGLAPGLYPTRTEDQYLNVYSNEFNFQIDS